MPLAGHKGVEKMPPVWEGVSPGKPGKYSQTPPSGEACNGHEGVVKYSRDETTST